MSLTNLTQTKFLKIAPMCNFQTQTEQMTSASALKHSAFSLLFLNASLRVLVGPFLEKVKKKNFNIFCQVESANFSSIISVHLFLSKFIQEHLKISVVHFLSQCFHLKFVLSQQFLSHFRFRFRFLLNLALCKT